MLVRSFGRLSTQTLSSLSTASPVTPPSFHLFGSAFGQSGSNLYFGAARPCACAGTRIPARRARHTTKKLGPAHTATIRRLRAFLIVSPISSHPLDCLVSTVTLLPINPDCHRHCA